MSSRPTRGAAREVLWASTSLATKGGVTSCVRTLLATPLREAWAIRHIGTHRDGGKATKVGAFASALPAFVVALARRPVLVHLHMASYGSFVRKATLAGLARSAGVPVVVHLHGGEFDQFHDRAPRPVRAAIRVTLERAAAVLALGDQWAQRLHRIAPRARVLVVPNSVTPVGPARQPDAGDPVRVVYLGAIEDGKGSFVLLDAWAKVSAAAATPARLVLAGNGQVARARARVAELGLGATVTVREWQSPVEVAELLRSAQVLTLPSFAEGQPMAVLEAMANGLCVVATDVGGIPELLGADGGLLVPPRDVDALADALLRAVDDPEERVVRGERALQRVRDRFDTEVVWRRIDDLYGQIARGEKELG